MAGLTSTLHVLFLLALLSGVHAGTVTAFNRCSFPVYCAIVKACPPEGSCPAISQQLSPGKALSTTTGLWPDNVGVTIMCSRTPNLDIVSQVEWTSKNADKKLHFDLSNVKGAVFADQGMTMYVDAPRTAAYPTCYGAVCLPGQNPCPYIYNTDYQNKRGMRACTQNVNVQWHMCHADRGLALPPPGKGVDKYWPVLPEWATTTSLASMTER